MLNGYMGKILFVDLSKGEIKEEALDEKICRDFIGGYGIGARILYSRQKAGVDPLGPENTLGLISGPLTGTPVPTGARYAAVAKSPLTGGWGDANSGGDFGPYLKFAGFDAVFFTGISPKPVYLLIDNGKAELKDAGYLWGKDAYETEDILMAEYGKESRVACIGQAGEKLALISCIMTDHGSTAGRSGLGAVMGSKKLKAVVARGTMDVPIADRDAPENLRVEKIKELRAPGPSDITIGNAPSTAPAQVHITRRTAATARSRTGVALVLLTSLTVPVSTVMFLQPVWRRDPVAGTARSLVKQSIKEGEGEYKYAAGSRRPEYETDAAFGPNCANSNTESISMANDICNRAGLDTISGGTVIGFAIELYENGILTKKDTDGIDLKWGNHQAMVAMTAKLANREGLGDILADGVKVAAEKIGKGAEKFAVHIGGQELGMHDPKLIRAHLCRWQRRVTKWMLPPGVIRLVSDHRVFPVIYVNSAGLCMFSGFGFTDRCLECLMQ